MDQLASENHTFKATKVEIDVYRGNWWIHSNVANFDSVPTRHQLDFKKALSTMHRLKEAEDEKRYAKWSQIPPLLLGNGPLLLGNGKQIGGSPIMSTHYKDGMTTDCTGQPVT